MSIKDTFSQAPSPKEEALYKRVLDEVEAGVIRKGIFAKALADCLGDEKKANSLYIKYRVQSLVDEKKYEAKHIAYERKQALEQAKIEAIEKEERDKKLAEEKIRLTKEQYKEDNSHKGFIWKMKDGYFGLAKAFWLYGIGGLFILYAFFSMLSILIISAPLPLSFYYMYSFFAPIYIMYFLLVVYFITTLLGVWNSARRYDGFKIWSILAKLIVIICCISLIMNVVSNSLILFIS